jgi:hypothetical protein
MIDAHIRRELSDNLRAATLFVAVWVAIAATIVASFAN